MRNTDNYSLRVPFVSESSGDSSTTPERVVGQFESLATGTSTSWRTLQRKQGSKLTAGSFALPSTVAEGSATNGNIPAIIAHVT
jgi:hypothetical protein